MITFNAMISRILMKQEKMRSAFHIICVAAGIVEDFKLTLRNSTEDNRMSYSRILQFQF